MRCNFEITDGIYLSQSPHKLDLHNNFDFQSLHYSIGDRTLSLKWRRSGGEWVPPSTPTSLGIEFREVSEFRFRPRNPRFPFTEDNCMSAFGFWKDEDWADGEIGVTLTQTPEPNWLTGIRFTSGAAIAVQAASAQAQIEV